MKNLLALLLLACQPMSLDMPVDAAMPDSLTPFPTTSPPRLKVRKFKGTDVTYAVTYTSTNADPAYMPLYDTMLSVPCQPQLIANQLYCLPPLGAAYYTDTACSSETVAISNTYDYLTGPTSAYFIRVGGLVRRSTPTYAKASTCNLIGNYDHYAASFVPGTTFATLGPLIP